MFAICWLVGQLGFSVLLGAFGVTLVCACFVVTVLETAFLVAFGFVITVFTSVAVLVELGVLVVSPTQTVTEDSSVLEPYCKPEEVDEPLEQALAGAEEERVKLVAIAKEIATTIRF